MSLSKSPMRPRAALSAVAAVALAAAGLSLLTTPSEAAPAAASSAAAPAKKGYTGAPVNPAPYTLTQPDGSTLQVHAFGDRLSNGVATVKGNYSLVKGDDGYWRYATGRTSSGELKASSVVAGQGTPPAAAKDLAPAPSAEATQAEAPPAGTGDDKELVILVQFANRASVGSTETQWSDHYFGATGSVDDFYEEASGNVFGLAPAAETCGTANNGVTNWITLPYAHPNTGVVNASEQYIADAIAATNGCVNYASFDTNGDGDLTTDELHVTVIGAGYETSYSGPATCGGGPSIWGHQWDLGSAGITAPSVDGVTVGNSGYTTFGEWHCAQSQPADGHKATIGIMAHEFGHDVNWPDLYDTDQSGEGVGEWSLMGSGSWGESTAPGHLPGDSPTHPDAFSLYYQGWITPTVATVADNIPVTANGAVLLGPNAGGANWVFNETEGDGEYFLLENRTQQGYDASTPGCGVVIYRIDETVTPSNAANADEDDPLVKVMQADGLEDLENGTDRGDAGDSWPGSADKHDFNNTTTPNSKFHDGTPSNLALHVDENACAATMHVDVTTVGVASPPVVRPSNDMFADAVTITGANPPNQTKNTEHATVEPGEPKPAGAGRASVWYRWVAPASGNVTIQTTGSDYDTVLGLYTGSAVNALTEVAANDDQVPGSVFTSKVVTPVTAGTTYQIAADGYGGDSGALTLALSFLPKVNATVSAVHAPEPSAYGTASSVTVTVSGSAGTATGSVTVKEGATTIGSGTLDAGGHATVALPATTAAGAHALTVSYVGDTHYNAGTGTVTANVSKASSTTAATAPKKVKFKKDFDVTATVAAAGGSNTGTVQVYDGSKLIGTGTLANGTVKIHITKNLKSGKHTLTVKYLGSANASASETTVKVKVKKKKKKKKH